jgi:hypothetical protein
VIKTFLNLADWRAWLLAMTLVVGVTSACATGSSDGRPTGPISRQELADVNAFSVSEAVDILRPTWMARLAGACYAEEPMDRDALGSLPLYGIREIRRISASEAASLCGAGGMEMMASGTFLHILRDG